MQKNTNKNLSKEALNKVSEKVKETTVSKRVRNIRSITFRTYLAISVTLFTVLAYWAHRINYFPIDLVVTRGIQSFNPLWFTFLMNVSSYIGFMPQAIIFVLIIFTGMFLIGLRFESILSLFNAIIITFLNLVIKDIVNRPRPNENLIHVFSRLTESSFPSGHVMFYTAYFGYLLFLTISMLRKSFYRTFLIIFLSLAIILIGPSRIYLGAHWSSDVTGAYLFSSIWLLFVIQIHKWGKSRFFVKQPIASEK